MLMQRVRPPGFMLFNGCGDMLVDNFYVAGIRGKVFRVFTGV